MWIKLHRQKKEVLAYFDHNILMWENNGGALIKRIDTNEYNYDESPEEIMALMGQDEGKYKEALKDVIDKYLNYSFKDTDIAVQKARKLLEEPC